MELAAHLADQLHEPTLDVGVDVLELRPKRKRAGLELAAHGLEPFHDRVALSVGQHARPRQRARPRDAAGDVLRPEPTIEGEGGREPLGGGVGPLREPAAPGLTHGSRAAMSAMMCSVTSRRAARAEPPLDENRRGRPKRTVIGVGRGI